MRPIFNSRNPSGLPQWPRWIEESRGEFIIVTGRHLTPFRFKVVSKLSSVSALVLMIAPLWGDGNVVGWMMGLLARVLASILGWMAPDGFYVCMVVGNFLLGSVSKKILFYIYKFMLARKTVVRFASDRFEILRWCSYWRRFTRINGGDMEFFVVPNEPPEKAPIGGNGTEPSKQNAPEPAGTNLWLRHSLNVMRIAMFAVEREADQFSILCQAASQQAVSKPVHGFPIRPTHIVVVQRHLKVKRIRSGGLGRW